MRAQAWHMQRAPPEAFVLGRSIMEEAQGRGMAGGM
jgi:hypothetical protein